MKTVGFWRRVENNIGIEGVVTGGGDDSDMGTVTEGKIYTQYQFQPQHVCMCIMY